MRRLTHLTVLLLALLLLVPAAASAHASLETSIPRDGEVLEEVPDEIVLEFSGSLTAGPDSIKVFAPDGSQVEQGEPSPSSGTRITQTISSKQTGQYGISFSMSSEDGHVIKDALFFTVGADTGDSNGAAAEAARDASKTDRPLQVGFSTARFIEVLALMIAAGGGIFACLIMPGWRPRYVLPALLTLLVAYGVGFMLNAAIIKGDGFQGAFDIEALRSAAETPFGLSLKIRAVIAVVAIGPALLLRQGRDIGLPGRLALSVVFVGLAASLSLTGHAVTTSPTLLRLPLDMVHVTAASIWIGGLVQLAFLAPYASANIPSIIRFSRTAFASVMVLLATGVYATYAELGVHPFELLESTYGRLIVAKLALYVGTMPLAGNNMQTFVPKLQSRPEDAPRLLRQYVWREFALLVVVLALTVWLIATPQPE